MTQTTTRKRRNKHGRVGVAARPPSHGTILRRQRRAEAFAEGTLKRQVERDSWKKRAAEERRNTEAKRRLRGAGGVRVRGESWVQAWERHLGFEKIAAEIREAHERKQAEAQRTFAEFEAEEEGRLREFADKVFNSKSGDSVTPDLPPEIIGVKEAAAILGCSETWVKAHASELGGEKHRLRWQFLKEIITERAQDGVGRTD